MNFCMCAHRCSQAHAHMSMHEQAFTGLHTHSCSQAPAHTRIGLCTHTHGHSQAPGAHVQACTYVHTHTCTQDTVKGQVSRAGSLARVHTHTYTHAKHGLCPKAQACWLLCGCGMCWRHAWARTHTPATRLSPPVLRGWHMRVPQYPMACACTCVPVGGGLRPFVSLLGPVPPPPVSGGTPACMHVTDQSH